ncbi:PDZ domain-containing protein [Amycolatopsis xylanica]|uniref:endopeptidase La n=1 Tax=Amycolatopsis xylanica TaxID=589385 RepID=A0A1H3T6Q5_9PSEU|nr:PDZ domain-containing protein [Amycolatopsis xylanica]SDZ45932.1 PDZ domain-containing protein [Amycolatopsis xylanica]
MSTPRDETAVESHQPQAAQAGPPRPERDHRLSRRGWTLVISAVLFLVFAALGFFAPVPFVAISPGPTYDTLGKDESGKPVVQINGHQEFQTTGELRMTTVSLRDGVTLFSALGLWASGRYALAPREEYFKPGETNDQVKQENVKQFEDSQSNAEVAALRHLKYPVKVLTKEVVAGSPADKVLAPGDRLVNVNGKDIVAEEDVRAALAGTKPGQTIPITFQHGNEPAKTTSLTLGQRPDRPEGFIGLTPIDRADVPFDVKISLENVGGPSAGLMFALAIVDRMETGDIAGGRHIAGTGEITEKGVVGPIGGISFKLVGAREAGATDFLVPERNCAEAKSAVPDGLNLIKVSTLDSALSALADLREGRPTPKC